MVHMHRCKFPDENSSVPYNLSEVTWTALSTPPVDDEGKSCYRYVGMRVYPNTTNFVQPEGEEETCMDGYTYDTSELQNTAITRWDIVCEDSWIRALVQSMYYIGQFFGSLVFGILGDKIGRKKVFFVAIMMQVTCGTIMAFVPHWSMFGILRIGLGFSHPGIFVIAVVIGSELVGPSKRRFAGVVTGVFFTFGQIILGGIAYGVRDYEKIQLCISIPALVFIVYWWIVPESARWLVSMKRFDEADKILQTAARINKVTLPPNWHEQLEAETDEDKKEEKEHHHDYSLFDLFRTPVMRKRALIAFFCWPVVSMVFYGLSMNPNFLGGDRYVVFILASAMEIPGLIVVFLLIDKIGRKALASGGYLLTSVCLFSTLVIPEHIKWLQVTQVIISKSAITGVYAVMYTFTPELFPTPIRNTAMGCCSMIARVGAISASYIAMWLVEKSKIAMVLLFATFTTLAGILSLFLPETMGTSLPDTIEGVESQPAQPIFICCKKRREQDAQLANGGDTQELSPLEEKA